MAFMGLLLAFVVAVFFLWISHTLQRSSVGKAYGRHGASHFLAGDDDGAIVNFTESILTEPTAAAYLGRGVAYFYKEDYDNAVADLTEAIQRNPNSAEAYYTRGVCYARIASRMGEDQGIGERGFADIAVADRLGLSDAEMRRHAKAVLAAYSAYQANQPRD
jgi:tetratricopeptide (TPR) repeat protein